MPTAATLILAAGDRGTSKLRTDDFRDPRSWVFFRAMGDIDGDGGADNPIGRTLVVVGKGENLPLPILPCPGSSLMELKGSDGKERSTKEFLRDDPPLGHDKPAPKLMGRPRRPHPRRESDATEEERGGQAGRQTKEGMKDISEQQAGSERVLHMNLQKIFKEFTTSLFTQLLQQGHKFKEILEEPNGEPASVFVRFRTMLPHNVPDRYRYVAPFLLPEDDEDEDEEDEDEDDSWTDTSKNSSNSSGEGVLGEGRAREAFPLSPELARMRDLLWKGFLSRSEQQQQHQTPHFLPPSNQAKPVYALLKALSSTNVNDSHWIASLRSGTPSPTPKKSITPKQQQQTKAKGQMHAHDNRRDYIPPSFEDPRLQLEWLEWAEKHDPNLFSPAQLKPQKRRASRLLRDLGEQEKKDDEENIRFFRSKGKLIFSDVTSPAAAAAHTPPRKLKGDVATGHTPEQGHTASSPVAGQHCRGRARSGGFSRLV
uniref:Uncharacterized protein n=1 Tax=Chromera velia CCMP2878 TaxID=1169474 RepID=A0A0G4FD40_9ALVE|eukprot:Cvel_16443.t1-p1 / transcript=Cvel_16443.t1 / gene=Cvel_16443 / organism=Chromera_velia_CCMP2878 / gene_product=hypothetical protein / transcript_product=hypothetical protein / location=Cvel_scaffold1267:29308-35889(+) / protein_length=482 / sequence_SO=supercontig / SO=protein_coding / is_pseudo=false